MNIRTSSHAKELAVKDHFGRGLFVALIVVGLTGMAVILSSYYLTRFGSVLGSSATATGVHTAKNLRAGLNTTGVLGVSTGSGVNAMEIVVASAEKIPGTDGRTTIRLNTVVSNKRAVSQVVEPQEAFSVLGRTGIVYKSLLQDDVTIVGNKVTNLVLDFSVPNIETVNWLRVTETDTTPRTFAIPY